MTSRYSQVNAGRAPRRSLIVAVSAVSLFILAIFAASNFNGPAHRNVVNTHKNDHGGSPLLTKPRATGTGDKYLLGVGKADITGPSVEINFAGYADTAQTGTGIRQRIYSRAFIVGDVNNPADRFVYIILDAQSGDTAVRYGVLEGLAALGSEYSVYKQGNVALTGTHSHSGPGAWFNYLLPQITSLGYDAQSYQAIVDGTVLSIKRAHESLAEVWIWQNPLDWNEQVANYVFRVILILVYISTPILILPFLTFCRNRGYRRWQPQPQPLRLHGQPGIRTSSVL